MITFIVCSAEILKKSIKIFHLTKWLFCYYTNIVIQCHGYFHVVKYDYTLFVTTFIFPYISYYVSLFNVESNEKEVNERFFLYHFNNQLHRIPNVTNMVVINIEQELFLICYDFELIFLPYSRLCNALAKLSARSERRTCGDGLRTWTLVCN